MNRPLRVAVVGARGIGKHHAKWYVRAGCELVAIFGTSAASAAAAAEAVRQIVPFEGVVCSDWERFLAGVDFDAASVCSPAEAHHANVLDLLRAGKHVLCEKPLVWDWDLSPHTLLLQGREMVEAARGGGLVLAVNAQYPACLPAFQDLHRRVLGSEATFPRLSYCMETKGQPRSGHGAAEVWVDLGPHPLAFLDAAAPGRVRWETLRERGEGLHTHLSFEWETRTQAIPVEMTLGRVPGGTPARRICNGALDAVYEGRNIDGEFMTVLRADGQEWVGPDLMRISVEHFLEAVRYRDPSRALVTGDAGLRQLEVLAGVWERCWRG